MGEVVVVVFGGFIFSGKKVVILEEFGIDLIKLVVEGKIDLIVGWKIEIEWVI